MFLRFNRRFKDGKEHRYWNIVESKRCAGGVVLAYQFHAYWVFRGKTRVETSADDRDTSPHIWARHTSAQHKELHLS
jgi:hypothetical protein